MKIRLTQIDGKLPNLALMKLSHWHKSNGDDVYLTRSVERELFQDEFDVVYGSAIFSFSQPMIERFVLNFPNAIIGGTGLWAKAFLEHSTALTQDIGKTVESEVIHSEYENYDYSIYPQFTGSIGFTQRGCRLRCKFCVVPEKEGKPRSVNTIHDIWKQNPLNTQKHIHLLDNDFFGQDKEQWMERVKEIKEGGFKVCFNQGINIRLITDESAHWIAQLPYYDDQFKAKRLYTAWDNLKDERIFFEGIDRLEKAGVNLSNVQVYMLIGFDPEETMDRIFHRFNKMVERKIRPFPMVYNNKDKELKRFQRWVVRRYYEFVKWEDYQKQPFNENPNQEMLLAPA